MSPVWWPAIVGLIDSRGGKDIEGVRAVEDAGELGREQQAGQEQCSIIPSKLWCIGVKISGSHAGQVQ
jgi:hypothetical protein